MTPPRADGAQDDRTPEFLRKHRGLMRIADRVVADDATDADQALHELAAQLPRHLAQEEHRDGLFDWLCALVDGHADTVNQLVCDHDTLRIQLKRVTAFIEAGEPDQAMRHAAELVATLRDHEERETALLRSALAKLEVG